MDGVGSPQTPGEDPARAPQLDELRERIAAVAADGGQTAIERVLVSYADAPTAPAASASGTVIALIAQGSKRLAIGERIYEYGAGQYLVASVDLPVTGHYVRATAAEPALGFGLVLDPATVMALMLEVAGPAPPRAGAAPPALGVADAGPELLDAVVRMLRLLDRPADIPVLAPMIERELLWRVINGPLGESVRQIGLADSSLTQISGAVRRITERFHEPFRVEDLARACDLSVSAFHRQFAAVTGLSPIQFQKRIRLHQARLLLLTEADDVASAGFRVGYRSATQFNREYRRAFGVSPGQEAARMRETTTQTG